MGKPIDLFYEEMGEGQPLFLLHGFPLDHTTWLPTAILLKQCFLCILPDLRGHGRSPVPGTEATISDMGADVIQLMDNLGIERAIMAGHSMGGYIAMRLAREYPERVSGLGLIATRADADSPERAAARIESRRDALAGRTETLIQNMLQRLTNREEIRTKILPVMTKADPRGIAMAQYAIATRENAAPWLENLTYPVVVVAGGNDIINTEDVSQSILAHLRDGRYYLGPDATHMVLMEEPGLIARALVETYIE
jgi:pimeloyl-ACP methyl ester carboxylesterase